jgi:hypothetical protein
MLVIGGRNAGGPLSSAEQYDPTTETWTATVALNAARQQHTATLLRDGRVLVVGGMNSGGPLDSAELFGRSKVSAAIDLTNLVQTYDGTARSVTATTTPPGLAVELRYNGSLNAPTNVGIYTVVGMVKDLRFQGSATNTLTILPAPIPIVLTSVAVQPDGVFEIEFSNLPGMTFSVLATTDATLSLGNWTVLGAAVEAPPGSGKFQFTDSQAPSQPQRFYLIRSP